jgi:hypothetical protein
VMAASSSDSKNEKPSSGEHPTVASSSGEHPTGEKKRKQASVPETARKRRNFCSETSSDSASGDEGSTDDFLVIFADTGEYAKEIQKASLIHDKRLQISEQDVQDTAGEFDPDVLIYPRVLNFDSTEWHMDVNSKWDGCLTANGALGAGSLPSPSRIVVQPASKSAAKLIDPTSSKVKIDVFAYRILTSGNKKVLTGRPR